MHLGKKPVEITAYTDFSIPSFSVSENKKEMGKKERVICDYLILWTFTEEQPALILTKNIGPPSPCIQVL